MVSKNTTRKSSEAYVESALVNLTKKYGCWCLKLPATFVKGVPDRLLLIPGGFVLFIETKATGQVPRKIQLFIHKKLKSLGFTVLVIDKAEDIKEILNYVEICTSQLPKN